MIEPTAASLTELNVIDEVVKSRLFPDGVLQTNFEVEFGEDSTGSPAVWIWLLIDDKHSDPTKAWIVEVGEFVSKLRDDLLDKKIRHWPYIELKPTSQATSH